MKLCYSAAQLPKQLGNHMVLAGQLKIAYTEYNLTEFAEALDHALDDGKNSKIMLRMPECSLDQ
jgi:hypothetical protein